MDRRALLLLPLLGGCSTPPPITGLPRRHELDAVPFHPQTRDHCGPAALATVLNHAGLAATPARLSDAVFLPGRAGSLQLEMLAGARRFGGVATRLPGDVRTLLQELLAGNPVLLLQNRGLAVAPVWHYAVLVGYDLDAGLLVLRSGEQRREHIDLTPFERTWARAGHWAITVLPPERLPATATEADALQAAIGFERAAPPLQAATAYRTLLARWPGNLVATLGLGNTLMAAGRHDEAAAAFTDAATAHDSAMAWINLGQLERLRERWEPARAAARAALRRAQAAEPRWLPLAQQLAVDTGANP